MKMDDQDLRAEIESRFEYHKQLMEETDRNSKEQMHWAVCVQYADLLDDRERLDELKPVHTVDEIKQRAEPSDPRKYYPSDFKWPVIYAILSTVFLLICYL